MKILTTRIFGILYGSIPTAHEMPYIERGKWQAVLTSPIQIRGCLRLFSSGVCGTWRPRWMRFASGLPLAKLPSTRGSQPADNLHIWGADFDRPADLHKPMPKSDITMLGVCYVV